MSAQLLSVIKDLTARAAEAPVPVIALTDEEVAALDGDLVGQGPVPLPWLDGKDKASRELACQVALRGLAARRLVAPLGEEAGGEVVALRDDLRAVLTMRRSAHAALCALRETDGRMRLLYLGASGALEEAISPGGLHGFTVVGHAAAAERLAAFADPDDAAAAAAEPGPETAPRVLPLTEIAAGAELPVTRARAVTMVTRLIFGAGDGGQRLTVYAKEKGVVVASPAEVGGAPALRFAEVSRSGLRERLAELCGLQDRP